MPVVEVEERWEGRGGSSDEQGVETLTRSWFVTTDDNNDGEDVVTAALPVALYDEHPAIPRAIARTFNCKPNGGPRSWIVDVGYSSARLRGPNGAPPTSPIDPDNPQRPSAADNNSTPADQRPPKFTFTFKESQQPVTKDNFDVVCKNTAGDLFEGLTARRDRLVISIEYYSTQITVAHILAYHLSVNRDEWHGFPEKTLLVSNFQFEPVYEHMEGAGGASIMALLNKVNIELEYEKDGWCPTQVLNAGVREIDVDGSIRYLCDRAGNPVDRPVRLDDDGFALPPYGDGATDDNPYREFNFYEIKPFDGDPPGTDPLII